MKKTETKMLLPLKRDYLSDYVYDVKGNFIFQFETEDEELMSKTIDQLNYFGEGNLINLDLNYQGDEIYLNSKLFIIMRGFGELTRYFGHRASEIQDNRRDWIIKKLKN